MLKSSSQLPVVIAELTSQARARGLTDAAWASKAGLRKETLSRLRRRSSCDFDTLTALAAVVDARLGILSTRVPNSTPDGHFVSEIDRDYEEQLVKLAASRSLQIERWASLGPRFFMAGLAVMLANVRELDRNGLLELAERLHPGASEAEVFARWLVSSPVRPSRFLPMVDVRLQHAA